MNNVLSIIKDTDEQNKKSIPESEFQIIELKRIE